MSRSTDDDPQVDDDSSSFDEDSIDEGSIDAGQDASYCCWACGEDIVIPIDLTMGSRQDYVEDCPVCCRPNDIHVEVEMTTGHVRCWNDAVG